MKYNIKLILGLITLLATNSAHSTLITESVDFDNRGVNYEITDFQYGAGSPSGKYAYNNTDLYLNGFDATLGTLNSVSMYFKTYISLKAIVTARDSSKGRTGWYDAAGESFSGIKAEVYLTDVTGGVNYKSWVKSKSQKATCSVRIKTSANCYEKKSNNSIWKTTVDLSGLDLDLFLDDSVRFNLFDSRYVAGSSDDADSHVTAYNNGSYWKGSVSLLYDYTATPIPTIASVPEPSAVALMALGLFGFGLTRRKVNKS